jgi:DNA-binding LacI/PurR family transcriptional regulator
MTARRVHPARPTLDDVAKRAGVGRGTVSRVVNGSTAVRPATRSAIERAIAELGYVPNRAARSLVTHSTDSVALVVSESEARVFTEPWFAQIIRGVNAALSQTSLTLWLVMVRSPTERDKVIEQLDQQYFDGVLLLSLHDDDPLPNVLVERGMPAVRAGRSASMLRDGTTPLSYVDVDNVAGAYTAVAHLAKLGRRTVATIAGPTDMGVGVARLEGYRQAVREFRLAQDDNLIAYGDFSEEQGARAARDILAARPDIDAVFAASDLMAAGAICALRDAGRRVPDDVALVGFDDATIARQTDPPLTTVHQPVEEMGRQMAELLVAHIEKPELRPTGVLLDTAIVCRRSA